MHLKMLQKKKKIKNQKKIQKKKKIIIIQKTAEATGDLICNKIAYRITKVSKTSSKNNSETNEEEILTERFIPPELRHKFINDLRLREERLFKI